MPKEKAAGKTPISTFRFDAETLAAIDKIASYYGLSGRADAVRISVRAMEREIAAEKNLVKSQKNRV